MEQIGKKALLIVEKLKFDVRVKATRQNNGTTEYLIHPISGIGLQWVPADRLEWRKETL